MKTLVTYPGGHPLSVNDLDHIQTGIKETIVNLMKALLSNGTSVPNCRLYGMVVTVYGSGDVDITAGACVLDGEICEFDYQLIPDGTILPGQYGVITYVDTYGPNNPVTYLDATTHNVHRIRKAHVIAQNTPASSTQLDWGASTPRFEQILKANLIGATGTFRYVGAVGQPAFLNSFTTGFPGAVTEQELRFIKLITSEVLVEGWMFFDGISTIGSFASLTPSTPLPIFTLPSGHRPDNLDTRISLPVQCPTGWVTFDIMINTTGSVEIVGAPLVGGGVVPTDFGGTNACARLSMRFMAL
jgi:hypothetical protein